MALKIAYDGVVKGCNRATTAVFAGLLALVFSTAAALGQINAAPPSVTSLGFGGRAINGTPPSVTSLGPRGYTPGFNPAFPNSRPFFGSGTGSGTHHHHRSSSYYPLGATVYAVPIYGYGYYDAQDEADSAPDEQYNGGPTIFDRRGPGPAPRPAAESYAERDTPQVAALSEPSPQEPAPTAQPQTVLVFKDGHQLEIENYAIVGDTLYNLTGDRRLKIPLSDLDLDATTKANDDRGIDFEVPPGSM